MTDLITAEDAKKLLDGSTPGPWEWTTGRFSNNPYLSPNILLLAFDGGGPDGVDPNDAANARLIAAAPDLARTVIALHAQLAEAQKREAGLREALERLGSMQAMTLPFVMKENSEANELRARIEFARTALATQEAGK